MAAPVASFAGPASQVAPSTRGFATIQATDLGLSPRTAGTSLAGATDPDPDVFGVDGKVGVHVGTSTDDFLPALALTPEGKILSAGLSVDSATGRRIQVISVTRRLADGSPDPAFGDNGIVLLKSLRGQATHLEPTADGGVVGSGFEFVAGVPQAVVFRLDAAGRLASGFGDAGVVRPPAAADGFGIETWLDLQTDGKIVVAGLTSADSVNVDISVRRLLANGAPDTGFGTKGQKIVDLSGDDEAGAIAVQTDGKIVVAGQTAHDDDALALRLTADGALDTTFGTDGLATFNVNGLDAASQLALQSDGKIDIVGETRTAADAPRDSVLFRLLADGRPDPSFNDTGRVVFDNPGDDSGFGIGIEPDQSIVVSSFQFQQPAVVTDSFLNRVTSTGKADPRFGADGTVRVHNPEATFEVGLAVQPDGRIVTSGRRGGFNNRDSVGTIDRFRTNGSFDSSLTPTN